VKNAAAGTPRGRSCSCLLAGTATATGNARQLQFAARCLHEPHVRPIDALVAIAIAAERRGDLLRDLVRPLASMAECGNRCVRHCPVFRESVLRVAFVRCQNYNARSFRVNTRQRSFQDCRNCRFAAGNNFDNAHAVNVSPLAFAAACSVCQSSSDTRPNCRAFVSNFSPAGFGGRPILSDFFCAIVSPFVKDAAADVAAACVASVILTA
jgi:plasmid stabilization system protein ParE